MENTRESRARMESRGQPVVTDEQHGELFADLLTRALGEAEVRASLADTAAPSAGELRTAAMAYRVPIMSQARGAEEQYHRAAAAQRAQNRTHRRWTVAALMSGCLMTLVFVAAAGASGWESELRSALTERRAVSLGGILASGASSAALYLVTSAFWGGMIWLLFYVFSPRLRAKDPRARAARRAVSILGSAAFAVLTSSIFLSFNAGAITWIYAHERLPAPGERSYGWEVPLFVGTNFVLLLAGVTFIVWYNSRAARASLGVHVDQLRGQWHDSLHESLLGFLRARISDELSEQSARRYATTLQLGPAPGLRRVRGLDWHVATPAEEQLEMISGGMDGGSIALAGPRGVGKTELLRSFCAGGEGTRLAVEVSAPVSYDRREFMLHLFAMLCERVMVADLKAAPEGRAHLEHLRYLRTTSREVNAGGDWGGWGLSVTRGTSRTRQPLSYPEIVRTLSDFLAVVAKELDAAEPRRRLVIAIDELDRIIPATSARDFLNELKVVFDVPHCLFVLSVSDEALKEADLAATGRRDAFDSAIDEVIRVEPLDYRTAVRLLNTRVIGLPEPFAALFYCLSGGMPRELLRTARAAVALIPPNGSRELAEITAALVKRELARIANSAGNGTAAPEELLQFFRVEQVTEQGGLRALGDRITEHAVSVPDGERLGATLANRAYYLDTVLAIFSAALSEELTKRASRPGHPGSFPALARAQHEIGTADGLSRSTLSEVRSAWKLDPLPPLTPPHPTEASVQQRDRWVAGHQSAQAT
ncbi:P-loop NTPase fold protein [Nonomuraea sp. JJY05]|uniref:P-loop NTPase fold protein n=1 Tax=Nonomuraea sp. JJY05 TaxID=3350255 RepID=UPI00373E9B7D